MTISSSVSRDCWLAGTVPIGISLAPSMLQISNSQGSRTSIRVTFSPRSSLCFTSAGVISKLSIGIHPQVAPALEPVRTVKLKLTLTARTAISLTLKMGLTFLEEGPQALGAIFRREAFHLLFDFVFQRLGQLGPLIAKQNLFQSAAGHTGSVHDALCERLRLVGKFVRRDDMVHQPHLQRSAPLDGKTR